MELSDAKEKKSPVTPPGNDPETVRLVAQYLNHYATPQRDTTYLLVFIRTSQHNLDILSAQRKQMMPADKHFSLHALQSYVQLVRPFTSVKI
jgi:hypothetical protein